MIFQRLKIKNMKARLKFEKFLASKGKNLTIWHSRSSQSVLKGSHACCSSAGGQMLYLLGRQARARDGACKPR